MACKVVIMAAAATALILSSFLLPSSGNTLLNKCFALLVVFYILLVCDSRKNIQNLCWIKQTQGPCARCSAAGFRIATTTQCVA